MEIWGKFRKEHHMGWFESRCSGCFAIWIRKLQTSGKICSQIIRNCSDLSGGFVPNSSQGTLPLNPPVGLPFPDLLTNFVPNLQVLASPLFKYSCCRHYYMISVSQKNKTIPCLFYCSVYIMLTDFYNNWHRVYWDDICNTKVIDLPTSPA